MGQRHSQLKNREPHSAFHGEIHGSRHVMDNDFEDIPYSAKNLFQRLAPDVVFDAFYNSAKRIEEHAVTCQPETRIKVLNEIRSWADKTTTPICWLSGPAGTGKTTVAHTIAKEYEGRGRLAGTFFFWRETGDRDRIHKVVPTLAYQIAKSMPMMRQQLEEALELRIPLSYIALKDQLEKVLLLKPWVKIKPADFKLVVIDGLDECDNPELTAKLLHWFFSNSFPFRILLTSRPEPHVTECFLSPFRGGKKDTVHLSLTESKEDIRKYFIQQLNIIKKKKKSLSSSEPPNWPLQSDVEQLVEKSEGLFIYAATAVRFIDEEGSPANRLNAVLKLHTGLDPLYNQVILEAKKWDYFDLVMGSILYLREQLSINELASILITNDGFLTLCDVRMAIHGCRSILVVPADDYTEIGFHHASLRDFLTDRSRSELLFYAPARAHMQLMAGCLGGITRALNDGRMAPNYALSSWHFHACTFLSETNNGEELVDINDDTEMSTEKIDKSLVVTLVISALDNPSYLKAVLPYTKRKMSMDRALNLEGKEKIITFILKNPKLEFIVGWIHACLKSG